MESRIEKSLRKKKKKRNNILKIMTIVFCAILFILGLLTTEYSIQELTFDNSHRIFSVSFRERQLSIELFGKIYVYEFFSYLNKIIRTIKWPDLSGHLIYINLFICYNCNDYLKLWGGRTWPKIDRRK